MSVWSQSNCVLTAKGNEALTAISAMGGKMNFDSVYTCGVRSSAGDLSTLTDLPQKNQKMTLVNFKQISSGYTINVQVTNEGLVTPYSIEMVGVYMTLIGFNSDAPFLYMVMLTDANTADRMTNISRSTYKYAIYLYHTNAATLNISLNSEDYVPTDTYESGISELSEDIDKVIFHIHPASDDVVDSNGYVHWSTENSETSPFEIPTSGSRTQNPVVIIHNYTGAIPNILNTDIVGAIIDDAGPIEFLPYDLDTLKIAHQFRGEDLVCTFFKDSEDYSYFRVTNYFNDTKYIPKTANVYTDFNSIPTGTEGFYSLKGSASNSPSTISDSYCWSVVVLSSSVAYIMIAVNNYDNSIYRRSISLSTSTWAWGNSASWTSIGGGGGVQTATAKFCTSGNAETESTTSSYLSIKRNVTVNALKAGDVIMCTLSNLSTVTSSNTITVRYLDGIYVSKYLKGVDNSSNVPCCQLPKYFLVQYDGTNFHLLTPTNTTTTVSTAEPTGGKHGDTWYMYV